MDKICENCSKPLGKTQKRFCSHRCLFTSGRKAWLEAKQRQTKECKQCGNIFKENRPGQLFCSPSCACRHNAQFAKIANTKPKEKRVCLECKKIFYVHHYRNDPLDVKVYAKFCSRKCGHIAQIGKAQQMEKLQKKNISKTDRAYVAGLFDGEGCIGIRKTKRKYSDGTSLDVSITNTCKEVLEWVSNLTPIGMVTERACRNPKWKPTFNYRIRSAFGCYQFLRLIEPHLIIKRVKAQEVIKFLQDRYHFN